MRFSAFLLMTLSAVLFSCSSGKEYDLKYRPVANTRYAFSNVTTMHMDQKMMGQAMKMDQEMIYDGTYDVGAMSSDSSFEVTLIYTRVRTTQNMMAPTAKVTKFDSDVRDTLTEAEDQAMYNEILNQPMKMKISKEGRVLEFSGMYDAVKKALASSEGDSKMAEEMAGQFTDDNMKGTMEYMFRIYPDGKVNANDSWEIEQKYEAGYPMKIQSKYLLEGEKDGRIILANTGTISTNKGGKGLSSMLATMIDLSGDQTGTIELDLKTGLPLVNSTKMNITGEMNMMGAKFPISMSTTSKVTLTPMK